MQVKKYLSLLHCRSRSQCLEVNSRNTRTRRRIFSKLIIKPPQRRVLMIANFEHILQPPVFIKVLFPIFSVNNYLFKVNNRNTRMCEI